MKATLENRVVLVTGAGGGLGREFVRQALERGARSVYATTRDGRAFDDPRVVPLVLDVTDEASVRAAAAAAPDVDVVVNNAGVLHAEDGSLLHDDEEILRSTFESNVFGPLRVAKAFAPVLAPNGGGVLIDVLSAASWISVPTAYAASKAAMWSVTNSLRLLLQDQGTLVTAVHVGMVDTPMSAGADVIKVSPASVVEQTYDGVADGRWEVIADDFTRELKRRLGEPAEALYAEPPRLDQMH